MKNAARLLGIIGGLVGLLFALTDLLVGGLGRLLHLPLSRLIAGLGWGALIASVVGLVGAALAISRPKVAGALMIIAAVGGFFSLYVFYVVAGLLLLVGGFLALFAQE
jgi:hypothetical protein